MYVDIKHIKIDLYAVNLCHFGCRAINTDRGNTSKPFRHVILNTGCLTNM